MESDVAYVRQQNEDEGAPPYSAQYAAFDQQPRGYTAYGDVQHLDSTDEGFAPPPHHEALQRPTRESAILQLIVSYWFGFVGALCVIFIGNKTTFILFHAWQGFFISTALWIICLCMVWSWIALLVAFLISAAILGGLTAVAIYDIKTEKCRKTPLLGRLCYYLGRRGAESSAEGHISARDSQF